MNKRHYSFAWMLLPFFILFTLASSMVFERSGVDYEIHYPPMQFLPQKTNLGNQASPISHSQTLVLYDSKGFAGTDHFETVRDVLDSMRVTYDTFDISSNGKYDLDNYEAVIVAFIEINKAESQMLELIDWVERGGRVLFSVRPDPSTTFIAIYRKLGIISYGNDLVNVAGIKFTSNILPGAEGLSFGTDFMFHNSQSVALEADCKLHAESADSYRTPLIWECDYGAGRFVVINSDQFTSKISRGIIGASYSLLFDVFAYPVINASVFFLDDFPSPIPGITDNAITAQFGRDLQNFYVNVWWPDMKELSDRYNLRFTGLLIETFNDYVIPPFDKQSDIERHQYFGGLILDNEGELGLLGYNHVPLCQSVDNKNQFLDYPTWPSTEAMELSIFELYSFARTLFPDNTFVTYVPPSNVLCSQARQWLPQVLPDLKVISSLYLEGEEGLAYEQEFMEASDGIVEFPRITTGYDISSYMKWAAVNELGLHFVSSHFVNPYEFLNQDVSADKGWVYLHGKLDEYISWLTNAAPGLRSMTSQEGAMAVQRFDRLTVNSKMVGNTYVITLNNFYDEAWLILRTDRTPSSVDGGTISQVSADKYLVKALKPEITIEFME